VFGVRNLIGFVWQWTWPFEDLHTRAALIKGGSYYRPSGSGWYMRQSTTLDTHNKYLLMDDSYDRSGGVGFRCVVDA
jgi:formylglycine-generating enzyme required for sulfatase activity